MRKSLGGREGGLAITRSTAVSVALSAAFLVGCRGWLSRSPIEEQRVRSPNGQIEAVIYRTRTDPLSSDILSVHLQPLGVTAERDRPVLRAEHTGLTIRWLQDRLLEVAYSQGEISGFYNTWWTLRLDPEGQRPYFVEVLLVKRPMDVQAGK